MIPYVEGCYFHSRENNIIFANLTHGGKIPLVKLHQKFINLTVLEGQSMKYMQHYMSMFPGLWQYIKEYPNTNEQLELF